MTLKEVNWSRMLLVFAVSSIGLFKTSQAAVFGDGLVKITTIITTMTIDHLEHHQGCVCVCTEYDFSKQNRAPLLSSM